MAIMSQVLTDQGRAREDIQHALRGSRQPNFRIAKNVVRCIRYRLAIRMRTQGGGSGGSSGSYRGSGRVEDDRLHQQSAGVMSMTPTTAPSSSTTSSLPSISQTDEEDNAIYGSESEMIFALSSASTNPQYSETYQRCCKVLVKIANLNQAKHFFWEVDSVMYPDYYSTIRRPMMIANIATNLIKKSYGIEYESNNENNNENGKNGSCTYDKNNGTVIAELFYKDMRQIVLNCFAYNTEVTAVYAQAQKLYQV